MRISIAGKMNILINSFFSAHCKIDKSKTETISSKWWMVYYKSHSNHFVSYNEYALSVHFITAT